MSPEAQRIAIAEACGWFCIRPYLRTRSHDRIRILKGAPKGGGSLRRIPDYLNDLNAMHEAEKVLTREQQHTYLNELNRQRNEAARASGDWQQLEPFWHVHATAAQRAEAFLRALNLWTS